MKWCSAEYIVSIGWIYLRSSLLLVCCFFFSTPLTAQEERITILEQELATCNQQFQDSGGLDPAILQEVQWQADRILNSPMPANATTDALRSEALLLLSKTYQSQNNLPAAFRAIKRSIQLIKQHHPGFDLRHLAQLDQCAFLLSVYQGQYEEAILLREQIIQLLRPLSPTERVLRYESIAINNLIQLADLKDRSGDTAGAEKLIEQVAVLLKTQTVTNQTRHRFQLFQLHYLYHHSALTEARRKAETLLNSLDNVPHQSKSHQQQLAATQAIYGNILYGLGQLSLAEKHYQLALANYQALSPFAAYAQAEIKHDLANCYQAQGKFDQGRVLLQTQIKQVAPNTADYDLRLADLYSSMAANYFAQYTADKQDISLLLEAIQHDKVSRKHYYQYRDQLLSLRDIQLAAATENLSQNRSLAILCEAYQQTGESTYFFQALEVLEQNKNIQLRAQLKRSQRTTFTTQLQQYDDLRSTLSELSYTLEYQPLLTVWQKDSLASELLQAKQHLQQAHTQLIQSFPAYQQQLWSAIKLDQKTLLQQLERQQQTLVCITSTENELYLLALSTSGYLFQKIPLSRVVLEKRINQFRQSIVHSPSQPDQQQLMELAALSREFYQLFLQPIEDIATERLLLLPDAPLATIPFSLFLKETVDTSRPLASWPFAVHHYSFSYSYALDFYLHPPNARKTASQQAILAFAPEFKARFLRGDSTRSAGELRKNAEEVAYLSTNFPCQAYVGDEARLARFRKLAPDYAILHLATHAVADPENGNYGFLTFSATEKEDYRLRASELYNMNISAALVVLSACETGLGEWQAGEGIVGLERAFTAAGAQSLLSTHWKVSDRASAQLMQLFYAQLAAGLPKDVALQQAQVQFINTHDPWLAHPFFWAGFVQKGATQPLSLTRSRFSGHWAYGWLLVFAGVVYLYQRRKAKN